MKAKDIDFAKGQQYKMITPASGGHRTSLKCSHSCCNETIKIVEVKKIINSQKSGRRVHLQTVDQGQNYGFILAADNENSVIDFEIDW